MGCDWIGEPGWFSRGKVHWTFPLHPKGESSRIDFFVHIYKRLNQAGSVFFF